MPHNHTAHEDLNGPDTLKRDLALAGCLVKAKLSPELILRDSLRVIDLVAKDKEGGVRQRLHGEKRIELGLRLGKALVVFGIDEEDNAADFREVIAPKTAGLCVASEIEGCELYVADGELLGGCVALE